MRELELELDRVGDKDDTHITMSMRAAPTSVGLRPPACARVDIATIHLCQRHTAASREAPIRAFLRHQRLYC